MKYRVEQRMIRKTHDEKYYVNTIFKYACEYTVNIKDICLFIYMDEKHKISMGKPNFPLAAVPHGRRVLVVNNESFQVGDHYFLTISLILTVILVNNIPKKIQTSLGIMVDLMLLSRSLLLILPPHCKMQQKLPVLLAEKYGSKELYLQC